MEGQRQGNKFLKSILRSRWYPGVFQWPTLLVFAVIVYELLIGVPVAHDNFGTAMTWVFWWSIIPLVFLLVGRFWCAICPFATLSDLVQKLVGNRRPVPRFLKRYGIWIIDACFILITWSDHVFGIVESPRGSGVLLSLIITGVVVSGAFFERRTWCRYLCFLGGLAGNYSRAGALQLRGDPEKCSRCTAFACFKGGAKAPGCPMFESPRTMDSNARCNFCGYCVKNCPHDSIAVSARMPSRELWFIRRPKLEESILAIVIMGIVFVQNITMLAIWDGIQQRLQQALGTTSYPVTFTVAFIIAMAVPVLLLYLAGWFAFLKNRQSATMNVTRFGYSLIPLDLAGHLAHNMFHLLAEGRSVLYTGLALFGMHSPEQSLALTGMDTITVIQYTLLFLGTLASIYTAYRIAGGRKDGRRETGAFLPHAVLVLVLAAFNVYLFTQPMSMRM